MASAISRKCRIESCSIESGSSVSIASGTRPIPRALCCRLASPRPSATTARTRGSIAARWSDGARTHREPHERALVEPDLVEERLRVLRERVVLVGAELVRLVGQAVAASVERDHPVALVEQQVEDPRPHPVDVDVAHEAVEQHDGLPVTLVVVEERAPVEALEVRHAEKVTRTR